MSRRCFFTDRHTTAGRQFTRRGRAKYLGGVGRRITSKTNRTFKANIQKVRALIDGKPVRLRVSAKAIKMGLIVKPLKRDWKPESAE